jgi:hypothetical protein
MPEKEFNGGSLWRDGRIVLLWERNLASLNLKFKGQRTAFLIMKIRLEQEQHIFEHTLPPVGSGTCGGEPN